MSTKQESKETIAKHGTELRYCSCESPFQDRTYGLGLRVHNRGSKKVRCTVCGTAKATS